MRSANWATAVSRSARAIPHGGGKQSPAIDDAAACRSEMGHPADGAKSHPRLSRSDGPGHQQPALTRRPMACDHDRSATSRSSGSMTMPCGMTPSHRNAPPHSRNRRRPASGWQHTAYRPTMGAAPHVKRGSTPIRTSADPPSVSAMTTASSTISVARELPQISLEGTVNSHAPVGSVHCNQSPLPPHERAAPHRQRRGT